MNLLAAVIAGHLIGDWVVQTDWQAANKATSWRANQQHVGSYHLALCTLLAVATSSVTVFLTITVASWVTHSLIDRRWPVRWLMEHTGSRPFSRTEWGVIAVDQALHLSLLVALAGWLA
jgi:hypothetical protein